MYEEMIFAMSSRIHGADAACIERERKIEIESGGD